MKIRIIALALLAITTWGFAGNRAHNAPPSDLRDAPNSGSALEQIGYGGSGNTPVPPRAAAPARATAKAAPAEWTIMVYQSGRNNLAWNALRDMNEMERVGSTDKVNVVTQSGRVDRFGAPGEAPLSWKGVRRYLVVRDNDTSTVTSPVVKDLGDTDMGDYRTLADFGRWAKANYPAKRYMLIVWNHGSGWTKSAGALTTLKGISYDEVSGNHISTPQLAQALREIGKVDVYGSDACLMQMVEVAYEIKDSADYIVGSEENEPGDGYPYDAFLAPLTARPEMSPAELARTAVDVFTEFYREKHICSTQSVIKAAALPRLLTLTDEFTETVLNSGGRSLTNYASHQATAFNTKDNKDLYDFTRLVAGHKNARVKAAGETLMKFITGELVLYSRTNSEDSGTPWPTEDYSRSKGIAIAIPEYGPGPGYEELAWAKESKWVRFLKQGF
jgi:hypothetical protein